MRPRAFPTMVPTNPEQSAVSAFFTFLYAVAECAPPHTYRPLPSNAIAFASAAARASSGVALALTCAFIAATVFLFVATIAFPAALPTAVAFPAADPDDGDTPAVRPGSARIFRT